MILIGGKTKRGKKDVSNTGSLTRTATFVERGVARHAAFNNKSCHFLVIYGLKKIGILLF